MHKETISLIARALENLLLIIGKGEKWAQKKKMSQKKLLASRLRPDMFNFCQQVQYAYFMALEVGVGLSGRAAPNLAYDETSTAELKASVKKTITFLHSIKPADLAGAGGRKVALFFEPKRQIGATLYVERVGIPNFFFHCVTAYDILRHIGVPINKDDYLGRV